MITITTTIVSKGEGVIEMMHRARGDLSTPHEARHATQILTLLTAYHEELAKTALASTLLVRDPQNHLQS